MSMETTSKKNTAKPEGEEAPKKRELKEAVKLFQSHLLDSLEQIESIRESLEGVQTGQSGLSMRLEDAESQLSIINGKMASLGEIKGLSESMDGLREENAEIAEILEDISNEIGSFGERMSSANSEIKQMHSDIAPLTTAVDSAADLARENGVVESDFPSQNAQDLLKGLVERAASVPNDLTERLDDLRRSVDDFEKDMKLENVPEPSVPTTRVSKSGTSDVMSYLSSSLKTLFSHVLDIRSKLGLNERDRGKSVPGRVESLEAQLDDLKTQFDSCKSEMGAQIDSLGTRINNLQSDVYAKLSELSQQLNEASENIDLMADIIESTHSEGEDNQGEA